MRREYILWVEGIGFGFIILLGWTTEILRLPHFLFAEPSLANWGRPLLKTVAILCVWAPVHVTTRRLLDRLHHLEEYLRICAWCRKMDNNGEWLTMEDYFGSAFATKTSHGVCPECRQAMENRTPIPPTQPMVGRMCVQGASNRDETTRGRTTLTTPRRDA